MLEAQPGRRSRSPRSAKAMPAACMWSPRAANDLIELRHESFDRRGFAEGAVRAAEWLNGKSGVWEFREIFEKL
jgi:hypothetical protein